MRVSLMIEGQEGVRWDQWRAIAAACEEHGVETLFRSDHYLSVEDRRERGALDAWATLAALAAVTSTVRLGTLVSPASFRHPAVLAKTAATVDQVSGGRVEVGLGAGWWEPEHELFRFPFPPVSERLDVLEEQLELLRRQWDDGPFSFNGAHYRVRDLDPQPKPVQRPRPPRLADEYNTFFITEEECRELRARLDDACEREGRDPATLPLSLMTGWVVGADRGELLSRAERLARTRGGEGDGEAYLRGLPGSWVTGTDDEAIERLRELEAAGVERVMLQNLLHEDLDVVALIGRQVAPALV
jgi:alkanesulfonate monooxygenase SsuD/methylene tetrahydromethanopterin reductase-like flavin-dependent oxidoreductase (luciferase family)